MNGRYIVWPERRFLSDTDLISWANDILADNDESPIDNLDDAVTILDDSGEVTFAKERR